MSDSAKKKDAKSAPTAKVGVSSQQNDTFNAIVFVQSGWRVALAFLLPSLLGLWLDSRYGNEDFRLFTMIGAVSGFVLANVVVFRFVNQKTKEGVVK